MLSTPKLSFAEANSLRNTMMNGDRPFANLVTAKLADINEDTEDWYLTDAGYAAVRAHTQENPTKVVL